MQVARPTSSGFDGVSSPSRPFKWFEPNAGAHLNGNNAPPLPPPHVEKKHYDVDALEFGGPFTLLLSPYLGPPARLLVALCSLCPRAQLRFLIFSLAHTLTSGLF